MILFLALLWYTRHAAILGSSPAERISLRPVSPWLPNQSKKLNDAQSSNYMPVIFKDWLFYEAEDLILAINSGERLYVFLLVIFLCPFFSYCHSDRLLIHLFQYQMKMRLFAKSSCSYYCNSVLFFYNWLILPTLLRPHLVCLIWKQMKLGPWGLESTLRWIHIFVLLTWNILNRSWDEFHLIYCNLAQWFNDVHTTDISDKCEDILNQLIKTHGCEVSYSAFPIHRLWFLYNTASVCICLWCIESFHFLDTFDNLVGIYVHQFKVVEVVIPELHEMRTAHVVSIGSETLSSLNPDCEDGSDRLINILLFCISPLLNKE